MLCWACAIQVVVCWHIPYLVWTTVKKLVKYGKVERERRRDNFHIGLLPPMHKHLQVPDT